MGTTVKVRGTAGSGKTRTLVEFARWHAERGAPLARVGGYSFTRAAARGMAQRVATAMRVEATRDDLAHWRTIHSECLHLLGLDRGVIAENHLPSFFREVNIPYDAAKRYSDEDDVLLDAVRGKEGNLLLAFNEWRRNRRLSVDEAYHIYPEVARERLWEAGFADPQSLRWFTDQMERWKAAHGLSDFSDLLEEVAESGMAPDVDVLLLDEMQDATPLQWAATAAWRERARWTYVAADPDQAIYPFIGATPDEFEALPCDREWPLLLNHRQAARLFHAAAGVINLNRRRQPQKLAAARDGGSIGRDYQLPPLDPEVPTFVMARNRYLLDDHIHELERVAVPFTCTRGGGGLTPTDELTAYRGLRALRQGWAINVPTLKAMADKVREKRRYALWRRGAKSHIKALEGDGAAASWDAATFAAEFAQPELAAAISAGRFHALMPGANPRRQAYWDAVLKRHGEELFQRPRLELGTIHSFKGRECHTGVLLSDMATATWREYQANPEAERRVLFVALTRARERMVVLDPATTRHYEELAWVGR